MRRLYHPGKANVVADALSRKSMGSLAHMAEVLRPLVEQLHALTLRDSQFGISDTRGLLAHIEIKSKASFTVKPTPIYPLTVRVSPTRFTAANK